MSIARVKASSLTQGLPKRKTILAGNETILPGSYESIATVTASGGESSLSFTSIPSTYKHLQVRGIARTNRASVEDQVRFRFNSDTSSNYAWHWLQGDGSTAAAQSETTKVSAWSIEASANNATASSFGAFVIDILDYASANKTKTLRTLTGYDANGNGLIVLGSNLWYKAPEIISTITIAPIFGTSFSQYSTFALYGIK